MGSLPPTREGGDYEDILLATALGGDDRSVLFDALRTGLRASYGFAAGIDGYTRDLRVLVLSGEVETAKLAEAETIVRESYAGFLQSPRIDNLAERKAPFGEGGAQTAEDPVAGSFAALMAMLDGQDPAMALSLPALLEDVTETTVRSRASSAFPAAESLIVLAVSPDAAALPGACLITAPSQAADCR